MKKEPNTELANLIMTIDRSKVKSIKLQQYYDYITLTWKLKVPETESDYIVHRSELNTRVMPKVA